MMVTFGQTEEHARLAKEHLSEKIGHAVIGSIVEIRHRNPDKLAGLFERGEASSRAGG